MNPTVERGESMRGIPKKGTSKSDKRAEYIEGLRTALIMKKQEQTIEAQKQIAREKEGLEAQKSMLLSAVIENLKNGGQAGGPMMQALLGAGGPSGAPPVGGPGMPPMGGPGGPPPMGGPGLPPGPPEGMPIGGPPMGGPGGPPPGMMPPQGGM